MKEQSRVKHSDIKNHAIHGFQAVVVTLLTAARLLTIDDGDESLHFDLFTFYVLIGYYLYDIPAMWLNNQLETFYLIHHILAFTLVIPFSIDCNYRHPIIILILVSTVTGIFQEV